MNRIQFDKLEKQDHWILIMIISMFLIAIGFIGPFKFENPIYYSYISAIGYLIPVIFLSKLFKFKSTVQWNKKGIVIRIRSFFGKSLQFNKIKETELSENTLDIIKIDGAKIQIDLTKNLASDTQKLREIITTNTNASNGDHR